jgi:hypothetical protein
MTTEAMNDPASEERVRDHVRYYSSLGPEAVSARIRELDAEWGVERALGAGLAGIGTFGLLMGLFGARIFRLLTWVSLPLLFAFCLGRWSPPASVTARRGLRTRKEIEEERYALKALRGDFREVGQPTEEETGSLGRRASRVLEAVRR